MGSVFGVFAYLTACSIRNRAGAMAKQIRSPRYALALLLGGAYIWYFLFNRTQLPRSESGGLFESVGVELFAALGMFVLFMRWWLFGSDRSAIAFSPAEIQFFFPAPVTRRSLIQFKLLRAQLPIIFNAALWVVLFGRGGTELPAGLRAISIWALFTIFMLHRLGATIIRATAVEHRGAGAKRNIVPLAIFGLASVGLLWTVAQAYPVLRSASGLPSVLRALTAVLQEPVPSALLAPFRLLVAPTFARTTGEWARDVVPVLVIAALHYLWVVRTELAFEDAAVDASMQRARRLEAMRARRTGGAVPVKVGKRAWIPLAPSGHPAVAIFWKNMLSFTRTSGQPIMGVILLMTFGITAGVLASTGEAGFSTILGTIALGLAGFSILVGSRFVRLDLRQDLVHLRLLRTYPVEGSALVAAEVAGSTVVLTIAQMGFLLVAHLLLLGQGAHILDVGTRTLALLAAPIVLIIFNAATVTIQNAAALLFPAWVKLGSARAGGVEVLGQTILTTIVSLLALALALLPAVIVGVAVFAGMQFLFEEAVPAAAIVAGVAALTTLSFEIVMAMMMLGEMFERGEMAGVTATS